MRVIIVFSVQSQVDAFKERLVSEAELATQAAAAASLAKQHAVAAAKAMTDASGLAGRCSALAPAVFSFYDAHSRRLHGIQQSHALQDLVHTAAAELEILVLRHPAFHMQTTLQSSSTPATSAGRSTGQTLRQMLQRQRRRSSGSQRQWLRHGLQHCASCGSRLQAKLQATNNTDGSQSRSLPKEPSRCFTLLSCVAWCCATSHSLDTCLVMVPAPQGGMVAQGYQQQLEEHVPVATRCVFVVAGVCCRSLSGGFSRSSCTSRLQRSTGVIP
jgi:hypothetical protein